MLRLVMTGVLLLALGCGDDDGGAGGDAGASGDAVWWDCTCGSRASQSAPRIDEMIMWCAADDPTEMLSDRYMRAAEQADRVGGGCDPCTETDEGCDPADNP